MIPRLSRPIALSVATAILVIVALAPARAVCAQEPVVRGELARLARQAYDYHYRNSNRNVFRRSQHYHPTKNVFRSSRYYQQRLAASFDGYPLRTSVRYTEHTPRGPREREYSFVHPRRHPYGPGPRGYEEYTGPIEDVSPMMRPHVAAYRDAVARYELALDQWDPPRRQPQSRAEIEMVPVRVAPRPATERAVMRTVTRPDGTTTTVITSIPIDAPDDEAEPAPPADDETPPSSDG